MMNGANEAFEPFEGCSVLYFYYVFFCIGIVPYSFFYNYAHISVSPQGPVWN